MAKVIPAILAEDENEFISLIRTAESFAEMLQVDIMDGRFVPSKSITCEVVKAAEIKTGWEAHLMVENPVDYFKCFKEAGTGQVIFHIEAVEDAGEAVKKAHALGLKAGIAINPDTPLEEIAPYVNKADSFLFMSVIPGFYGSKFIPEVLDKIKRFRKLAPNAVIGIDGGIKEYNIKDAADAGANVIGVGSAISLQENPAKAYEKLSAMVA